MANNSCRVVFMDKIKKMLINGMYRNKMYGCKTKPESPITQGTTDQT